jgi:sortase A
MRDRRCVEELTVQELEEVLTIRRREERLERMRRIGVTGRQGSTVIIHEIDDGPASAALGQGHTGSDLPSLTIPGFGLDQDAGSQGRTETWRERILLGIEVAAVLGVIAVIASIFVSVRNLNRDWKAQQSTNPIPTPTATPLIRVAILPGGHRPPTTSGGEAQPLGPVPKLVIPSPGPQSSTRLVIPSIDVDVPVVEGDDWEQLKKGAGHHLGSANPGERGNCFISGHNDIYGEIFRDLEEVKIGDQITLYAGQQPYQYIVRATRIVDPDDVSVMYPTSAPVLTLMTCYPYMVDSHRLIVIAELER